MTDLAPKTTFLPWLNSGDALGNDELVAAIVPLLEQCIAAHDRGLVGPLEGVDALFVEASVLYVRKEAFRRPIINLSALRAVDDPSRNSGLKVVNHSVETTDIDSGDFTRTSSLVSNQNQAVERPVYLPGYVSWEHLVGHHDPLTDVFVLGLVFASLATGWDLCHPEQLEEFVTHRDRLITKVPGLHPVLARAIVRMTELRRHERVQDLVHLCERVRCYRDVELSMIDDSLDFRRIEGFLHADRTTKRSLIASRLRSRLYELSRRNRLVWFKPRATELDLTQGSVPTSLHLERVSLDQLFVWQGRLEKDLRAGKAVRLERYLRFEERPYLGANLDKIRNAASRGVKEYGSSPLRLVIAFLSWTNLRESPVERILSPLLLLPCTLSKRKGVRDAHVLTPTSSIAQVNPVLRHLLEQLYDLELPESVDLEKTDLTLFHKTLAATINRSEPAVSLKLITRPPIELIVQRARRKLTTWRRRSSVSGRGVRRKYEVNYCYKKTNYKPLGLQLFLDRIRPPEFSVEQVLKGVKEESHGDGQTTVTRNREVYRHVADPASGPHDWSVDLCRITLANFNYRKMSLVSDYNQILDETTAEEHAAFDTLFSLDARDLVEPPIQQSSLDLHLVLPADASQAQAVRWARSGLHFIIQGPPGTGKSQTITNLIADFVSQGKRVLFVCQKRAALDVVYHRLAGHGLDELAVRVHDSQTDKRGFIADLKGTYEAWVQAMPKRSGQEDRATLAAQLKSTLQSVERYAEVMSQPAVGSDQSLLVLLRLSLGCEVQLSPQQLERVPSHRQWERWGPAAVAVGQAMSDEGQTGELYECGLRWLSEQALSDRHPLQHVGQLLTSFNEHLSVVQRSLQRLGTQSVQDLTHAVFLAQQVQWLAAAGQLSLLDRSSALSLSLASTEASVQQAARRSSEAEKQVGHWRTRLPQGDVSTALEQARHFEGHLCRFVVPAFWAFRRAMFKGYDWSKHTIQPSYSAVIAKLQEVYDSVDAVGEEERRGAHLFAVSHFSDFASRVELTRQLLAKPEHRALLLGWARAQDGEQQVSVFVDAKDHLQALLEVADQLFDKRGELELSALIARRDEVVSSLRDLPALHTSLLAFSRADAEFKEALRELPVGLERWPGVVSREAVNRTLLENRAVSRFDGDQLSRAVREVSQELFRYRQLNAKAIVQRTAQRFRQRLQLANAKAKELTTSEKQMKKAYNAGRRVLEREFEKVMRHRSIRDLSSGDSGTVVYDLKPIWLMSPLSISDTLPLEEQRFDVVIFDEASQIPLEEAIPSVYRARQLIVVGDKNQLPPTTFFASKQEEEALELQNALGEVVSYDLNAESFLSHAAQILPSTMLKVHYRSQSEDLIRFCNEAFYGGALLTVPDRLRPTARPPIETSDPTQSAAAEVLCRPVSFHHLQNSPYVRRQNQKEATYIASLVRDLLLKGTGLTLGVVAFSEAQQGAIEQALTLLASSDAAFRRLYEAEIEREQEGQYVGLFVKNLENVQGDERDIIVLSVCYGPDSKGQMRMNFGPINKGGGEKRLNVVFSRSKQHMVVVSSIVADQITNDYNDGANTLKRYLQYAQAVSEGDEQRALSSLGAVAQVKTSQPETDVVIDEIRQALLRRGMLVSADVGGSNLKVPLAVRTTELGAHEVAVLVDSDEHYKNRDVLDRVVGTPGLLVYGGWTVVMVLTKDWLKDPERCLLRIQEALLDHPEEE